MARSIKSDILTAYTVTQNTVCSHEEEALHDEFVEWLHSSPLSWEGDESGVCFYDMGHSGGELLAAPGDWVVNIHRGNQWCVLPAAADPMLLCLEAGQRATGAFMSMQKE